jgi:hypothetical protein
MVMLEQTLPWSVKWNTGLQASGKKYNLQGYTGGMSFAFTTLNKAFCNDRLNVSLFFMTPLADKLNIEMESRGAQFSNHTTIKVPIRMAQLSVTWKFGNTKRQFAQYQSKIRTTTANGRPKARPSTTWAPDRVCSCHPESPEGGRNSAVARFPETPHTLCQTRELISV